MKRFVIAVAVLAAATGTVVAGCSSSATSDDHTSSSSHGTASAPAGTPTGAVTTAAPLVPAGDADVQGFTIFNGKARCLGSDHAEMYMRTTNSALVVCRSEINRLYYRGYRIADGANIDLYEVYPQDSGFVAVNAPDNARYVITGTGFRVIQDGKVFTDETATGIGPQSWASTQAHNTMSASPQATSTIVLGASQSVNDTGYGTARPSAISLGTCSNSIGQIVWHDWGNDVAFGSGIGCSTTGTGRQYSLVASDIGICKGVLAYRKLKIGSNDSATDIC